MGGNPIREGLTNPPVASPGTEAVTLGCEKFRVFIKQGEIKKTDLVDSADFRIVFSPVKIVELVERSIADGYEKI